eukprot:964437_1
MTGREEGSEIPLPMRYRFLCSRLNEQEHSLEAVLENARANLALTQSQGTSQGGQEFVRDNLIHSLTQMVGFLDSNLNDSEKTENSISQLESDKLDCQRSLSEHVTALRSSDDYLSPDIQKMGKPNWNEKKSTITLEWLRQSDKHSTLFSKATSQNDICIPVSALSKQSSPKLSKSPTVSSSSWRTQNNVRKNTHPMNIISSRPSHSSRGSSYNLNNRRNERRLDPRREEPQSDRSSFITGAEKYEIDEFKKTGRRPQLGPRRGQKTVGAKRKFVSPFAENSSTPSFVRKAVESNMNGNVADGKSGEEELPERLKGCDPKLVEMIRNDIMDRSPTVRWNDIAGLEFQKQAVKEIIVWPLLRPDIFTGLRGPPKGILLFGPPGTGKTLIGKAIASEAGAKFFSISASSLTSKWHGEGEKLVKTLFAVAGYESPAVIFIDEIDSLLSQRSSSEFEASRRIKTEFLVQLDGVNSFPDERVVLVGATNRPQELDEAARRRLVKRLYIPLPDSPSRRVLFTHLLRSEQHDLSDSDLELICKGSDGYSGADIKALSTEAAYGPIRSVSNIQDLDSAKVRNINVGDFLAALKQVRASVSPADLQQYIDWDNMFGSFSENANDTSVPIPIDAELSG